MEWAILILLGVIAWALLEIRAAIKSVERTASSFWSEYARIYLTQEFGPIPVRPQPTDRQNSN